MLETGFPVVALITLPLMAEAKGKGMPPITRRATQTAKGEIAEEARGQVLVNIANRVINGSDGAPY